MLGCSGARVRPEYRRKHSHPTPRRHTPRAELEELRAKKRSTIAAREAASTTVHPTAMPFPAAQLPPSSSAYTSAGLDGADEFVVYRGDTGEPLPLRPSMSITASPRATGTGGAQPAISAAAPTSASPPPGRVAPGPGPGPGTGRGTGSTRRVWSHSGRVLTEQQARTWRL